VERQVEEQEIYTSYHDAVFRALCTGTRWRDLPQDYGKWGTVHQRFIRWRRRGVWENLLEKLINEPDYEWLMIEQAISRSILTLPGHPIFAM